MSGIVFNHLPQLTRDLERAMGVIVEDTCHQIESRAQGNLVPGHGYRSGSLKKSERTEVDGTNGIVGYDDFKANWTEYGTVKEAARPFLTPAAEEVRPAWNRATGNLERHLR